MADNLVKPLMDQAFFIQRFDETNVGFRPDSAMNSARQEIAKIQLESEIRDFVPNNVWRKEIEKQLEKGHVEQDPEITRLLQIGLRQNKIKEDSPMGDVLDYLEDAREKNLEWKKTLIGLKDDLSERYYDRLGFWAKEKNIKGIFAGESVDDRFYRFDHKEYDKAQNMDGIDKRIAEYQRQYFKIFGEADPNFRITSDNEEQNNEVRERFYNQILRSKAHEDRQFEIFLRDDASVMDYSSHPEAARYQFLEASYHNPEFLSPAEQAIVEAIKNNPDIPENEKIKAFLTVADNNMVRDGLISAEETLYADPNFKFDNDKVLRDAGISQPEYNDTQKALMSVFDNPLESIKYSLPKDVQDEFQRVMDAYKDDNTVELDDTTLNEIRSYLPDDIQNQFNDVYAKVANTSTTPAYVHTLQQSNAMANENKLSDASLSQINEATQSMLDLGKNEENLIELTNNAALERKHELNNEMTLKNNKTNTQTMKMGLKPS